MRFKTRNAWWGDLGGAAIVCLAVALGLTGAGVRAADTVATNLDLMTRLTSEVVTELHGKFNGTVAGRSLQLKPAGTTEDYVFVTSVFTAELTRAGETTVAPALATDAAPAGASDLVLHYQNVVFGLKYVDTRRSHVVGGKRVERQAGVRIMATLSDPTGRVLWVGEAGREAQDEFDYGLAAEVEQGTYQFAHPTMPAGGWGRYAEPVFVTGIIVGLIYLFFSNQSDN